MIFNRIVRVPKSFAEFLNVEEDEEVSFAEMQSLLYDRLYRLGAIRQLNGDRATRKRVRGEAAARRREIRDDYIISNTGRTRTARARARRRTARAR